MKLDGVGGVVQALEIEADKYPALLGACMVAVVEHATATHFGEITDKDGGNALSLRWTDGATPSSPLPFDLKGPNEIAAFVRQWLEKKAVWPSERPGTDGSTNRGFRVEVRDFYDVLTVKPVWIIYGK